MARIEPDMTPTQIQCITDSKPWVEVYDDDGELKAGDAHRKSLAKMEIAVVPRHIADQLRKNEHASILGVIQKPIEPKAPE